MNKYILEHQHLTEHVHYIEKNQPRPTHDTGEMRNAPLYQHRKETKRFEL